METNGRSKEQYIKEIILTHHMYFLKIINKNQWKVQSAKQRLQI